MSSDKPRLPPYLPPSTFLSTIESWRAVRPSRVDRDVLSKVAGSMQTWLIAALKYFALIDENGVPTPKLDRLATASEQERPKLLDEMLRAGYPYLFTRDVNLSSITSSDLRERFVTAGAKGETAVKAMSFFTGMAKAAGIKLSPYVLTRQRRSNGGGGKRSAKKTEPIIVPIHHQPAPQTAATKTAFEVLYEALDPEAMDDTEQQAVWTLLRYLKKKEGR